MDFVLRDGRMWRVGAALLAIGMILGAGCVRGGLKRADIKRFTAAGAALAESPNEYRLQTGDEISIEVFREPALSGPFRLDGVGNVVHTLWGAIALSGATVDEAQVRIAERLAVDILVHPRVLVKLLRIQSAQIVVLGEVNKPGVYPFPVDESMTLLRAIAMAGGFTELASPDRVRIVRTEDGKQRSIRVRVARLLAGKSNEKDVALLANDVIDVPQIRF